MLQYMFSLLLQHVWDVKPQILLLLLLTFSIIIGAGHHPGIVLQLVLPPDPFWVFFSNETQLKVSDSVKRLAKK